MPDENTIPAFEMGWSQGTRETIFIKRGWKPKYPIDSKDKKQMYACVLLAESVPVRYTVCARIDWIQDFGQDYVNWDKNKMFQCYLSRNLSDEPDFTHQHRKKYLQPYPAIYTGQVKHIFVRPDEPMSENEPGLDNESVCTQQSNITAPEDECSEGSHTPAKKYEEKLKLALENATAQSSETRVNGLQAIEKILSQCFLPDFVEKQKTTIMDILREAIRHGIGAEQSAAAQIVSMLVLQLGGGNEFVKELGPILLVTALNQSNALNVRAKCCLGLGLLHFLGNENIEDIVLLMQQLESIFSGSYLKGNKKTSTISADVCELHCAALSAWGLLLTLIPTGNFCNMFQKNTFSPSMTNLIGMLQSQHVDVRTTVSEVIALILESGRHYDEDFQEAYLSELIDVTKQLAKDTNKWETKRDRKAQRSTFRDFILYLEENESPDICIRFGNESLELNTWAIHHQYTALCAILGPGMTSHLAENDFLRDVLQMGPKIQKHAGEMNKQSKHERQVRHTASSKARTLSRGQNRDERSAIFA